MSATNSHSDAERLIAAVEAIQAAYTSRDKFPVFEAWAELDAARMALRSTLSEIAPEIEQRKVWDMLLLSNCSDHTLTGAAKLRRILDDLIESRAQPCVAVPLVDESVCHHGYLRRHCNICTVKP